MLIRGFSKALFSTWFQVSEIRAVFDAGEGINFFLAGRLTRVDFVFLTHGHTDHFAGLLNLLVARARLGPREEAVAPLSIYYPAADANLRLYVAYIQQHLQLNGFPELARWQPVGPGEDYPLPGLRRHWVRVFPVSHGPLPSVGYCVFETRDKVRAEYAGRPPREIGQLIARQGRPQVLVPVDVPLVCYTGDSEGRVDAPCSRPLLLLHEATFLTEPDRSGSKHATLEEALDAAGRLAPAELLLFHFSARYTAEEIRRALSERLAAQPLESCRIFCALPGRFFSNGSAPPPAAPGAAPAEA